MRCKGKKERNDTDYMAYFRVHSRAVASYLARSVLYKWAISGTRGSSGLGSVSIEQIDRSTVQRKRARVSENVPGGQRRRYVADDQIAGTTERTFRDGQCWAPLVPQDVQANRAVGVDVRVVDLRRERDLGRLEGVVGGERDGKEEDASSVRRVTLAVVTDAVQK